MRLVSLIGIASSLGAALLWLALIMIAVLAVVLYWPRNFSGPLTEYERHAVRAGTRVRSRLVAFGTPIATIIGFVLLLPPPVALTVTSKAMRGSWSTLGSMQSESWLAGFSLERSVAPWTCDVMRHAQLIAGRRRTPNRGELRLAILEAADEGFPGSCDSIDWEVIGTWGIVSVELSLVELAARAYLLTSVNISAGPSLTDPDPWELMRRTLAARDITTTISRPTNLGQESMVLRLGRAQLNDASDKIEVLAIVQRGTCGEKWSGKLLSVADDGRAELDCELEVIDKDCTQVSRGSQRAVTLLASCGDIPEDVSAWVLSVDYGQAQVIPDSTRAIQVAGGEIASALEVLRESSSAKAFDAEVQRHALSPLREAGGEGTDIVVESGADSIVVRSSTANLAPYNGDDSRVLELGPFSWAGFPRIPEIHCGGDMVEIQVSPEVLKPGSSVYDPTAFFATMHTITWAANALHRGSCEEPREPRPLSGTLPRPLLTAEEIGVAVGSLNRGRETLGLVLLTLALALLALALRRSAR